MLKCNIKSISILIACYWVNNERIDLTASTLSKDAVAWDIFVKGGQIYTGGYYINKDGSRVYCYWINGERTDLIALPPNFTKYPGIRTTFSQDGTIYSLGYYLDSYDNHIPCYWINTKDRFYR